jgi:hypothetical protein
MPKSEERKAKDRISRKARGEAARRLKAARIAMIHKAAIDAITRWIEEGWGGSPAGQTGQAPPKKRRSPNRA